MTLRTRRLSNYNNHSSQMDAIKGKIDSYLAKKFRISKSYSTKSGYGASLKRFGLFLNKKDTDIIQTLKQIKDTKKIDPISLLDEFYSDLSDDKKRLANNTIRLYITAVKDFLNSEGCKIYNEDLKHRFRLPKKNRAFEEGLTKKTIYRIIRLANQKLATVILIICSSGMRIAEVAQLRVDDIDFTADPATVMVRAQTTKTREARITCISTEAKLALQDYMQRSGITSGYLFLKTYEQKIAELKSIYENAHYQNVGYNGGDKKRLAKLERDLKNLPKEDLHEKAVISTKHSLESSLVLVIKNISELSKKTEHGRYAIHFHALRAWFKTQVTDSHQSDFAEALMGHKSLKLDYYRQNNEARARIYLEIEHSLTIADTEKIEKSHGKIQKENLELRGMINSLSQQLQNLEQKIEIHY